MSFIFFDDTIRKVISSGSSIIHTIGYLILGPDTKLLLYHMCRHQICTWISVALVPIDVHVPLFLLPFLSMFSNRVSLTLYLGLNALCLVSVEVLDIVEWRILFLSVSLSLHDEVFQVFFDTFPMECYFFVLLFSILVVFHVLFSSYFFQFLLHFIDLSLW